VIRALVRIFGNIVGISIAVGTIAVTERYLLNPIATDFSQIATATENLNRTDKSIQLVHTLTEHDSPIFGIKALTIAPDGRTLVSGARDGKIILWNLQTGERLGEWLADKEGVETIAIDRDGKMLVSGGIDRQIKVWSYPDGKLLHEISGHSAPISKVIIVAEPTTNRQLIISTSDDRTIRIWDLSTYRAVGTLDGITGYAADLIITPDRRYAIASEKQGIGDNTTPKIQIWDWYQRKKIVRTIPLPESGFSPLAVTPDSKYLIGGSFGQLTGRNSAINTLKLWQIATGKLNYEFPDNVESIESLVVSKDGKLLVCGTYDGKVKVWDLSTRKLLSETKSYGKPIVKLTISNDGHTLVGGLEDGRISIWQLGNFVQ
jgi:COMPASS component SWD3